jgi:hypothetical protein
MTEGNWSSALGPAITSVPAVNVNTWANVPAPGRSERSYSRWQLVVNS